METMLPCGRELGLRRWKDEGGHSEEEQDVGR